MSRKKKLKNDKAANHESAPELTWLRAAYHLHTFAYRDPRSAFASGIALPAVSPTTVLLAIVSTLFFIGEAEQAQKFMTVMRDCDVLVDTPNGVIFFRAFHQLRRYETLKYGANPRYGLTKINQGTREYGLVDGVVTLYVGVPLDQIEPTKLALRNLRHLGTHDSLCSLVTDVEQCARPSPQEVLYLPSQEVSLKLKNETLTILENGITVVTLSRFKREGKLNQKLKHWYLVGGSDTERTSYIIPGTFQGTTKGKIYKRKQQ